MSMDMTALTPAELLLLLQKAGAKQLAKDTIERHIAAGAPVTADGRLNFIHYVAWLASHVK